MDKLAGIISGNVTHDQRNVLALLEIVRLSNETMLFDDKIYRVLGTIIDTFDAEYGVLIVCQEQNPKTLKVYARKVQYRDGLRKNATTKNRRQSTETKSRSLHGGLGQCQRN